jgi:hypothetical protein
MIARIALQHRRGMDIIQYFLQNQKEGEAGVGAGRAGVGALVEAVGNE